MKIGFEFEFAGKDGPLATQRSLQKELGFEFIGEYDEDGYNNYSSWCLTDDGSIETTSTNEYDHELVSPILNYNDGLQSLANVFTWMAEHKVVTNSSTGLHVNISLDRARMNKLDKMKFVLLSRENEIAKKFNRDKKYYSFSQAYMIHDSIRNKHYRDGALKAFLKGANIADLSEHIRIQKYSSINFNHLPTYIEFRAMGGRKYHKRLDEVVESIEIIKDALIQSCDPNIEPEECIQLLEEFKTLKVPAEFNW